MAFISGTTGNDTLSGTSGNDFIFGYSGNDILRGRDGDDFLDGGNGNDRLFGDNGRDTIFGGEGEDWLEGGNGNDYLDGGESSDRVFGGNGDDVISADSTAKVDTIDGGRGIDTALLQGRDTFDLRQTTNVERIEQAPGNAEVLLDTEFLLTADSDTVVIDMRDGGSDRVDILFDSHLLAFALVAGKIRFGEPGDLDKTLALENVEGLRLYDGNAPTADHVFDHWLV